ncbi:MAG: hypothetical protein ACKVY0_03695 [Prosthecobacter sp.]|uniref:hypothetical protein n=1 Tax=Prosthecobacter sp. TaxID=1965333 RepID=UPI0039021BD5
MNRLSFILLCVLPISAVPIVAADASKAAEQAHRELWRRFIDKHGIMIDFADMDGKVSLPTPEECKAGKPNALGWWAPIENGAMFNGLYMDAAVNRWKRTKSDEDATKARKLMEGLLLLNSISEVKGFVGRGVSTDGKSHYPMGSNDQTSPWFLGLWRYLDSGLATDEERARIAKHLVETTDAIVAMKWSMPAEQPFGRRGGFGGFSFDSAPRMLFVCKLLHVVTGEAKWDKLYRDALVERGGKENRTRLEVCEHGMVFEYARYHTWTSCTCVAAVRALWEMEKDKTIRAAYAKGLQASADLAFKSLPMAQQFDNADTSHFEMDWRVMNKDWKPQQTELEAQDLAHLQLRNFLKVSPRRAKETEFVREPTAAAWVVTLAPDAAILKQRRAEVEKVISHYDYAKLYYSQFFWVDGAWERLLQLNHD